MAKTTANTMDESTRRYYLDVMGIQCWQQLAMSNEQEINKTISQCTQCGLYKTRKQALPGRGNSSAGLMFVMLSPDSRDDDCGDLCSGEANNLFVKMLSAIGIAMDDVYITSLLKCKVPQTHTVSPEEVQSCKHHLLQQIQFVNPALIIVLGETAVRCLLQKDVSLDDCRVKNTVLSEKALPQIFSVPLFVSYSPQELLLQPENKAKAWSDLQQLQKLLQQH